MNVIAQRDSDLPFDFLAHLQRELGIEMDATVSLLGEWLARYEPAPRIVRSDNRSSPPPGSHDDSVSRALIQR